MNSNSFTLTKNEQEIMELLWSENQPLSRSQIIELSTERSWKSSSIHILLNQLLKKEAIKVDGFVKTGKNYGRTFSASITKGDYEAMQLKKSFGTFSLKSADLGDFVASLFQDEEIDDETLNRLEAILEAKKGSKKK